MEFIINKNLFICRGYYIGVEKIYNKTKFYRLYYNIKEKELYFIIPFGYDIVDFYGVLFIDDSISFKQNNLYESIPRFSFEDQYDIESDTFSFTDLTYMTKLAYSYGEKKNVTDYGIMLYNMERVLYSINIAMNEDIIIRDGKVVVTKMVKKRRYELK